MSSPEQEQAELETIEVDHNIAMGEALERLKENPDYKLVIANGYMKQSALNAVSLLALPARQIDSITAGGGRAKVMEDLISISNLQYHLDIVEQFYISAVAEANGDSGFEEDEEDEDENTSGVLQ